MTQLSGAKNPPSPFTTLYPTPFVLFLSLRATLPPIQDSCIKSLSELRSTESNMNLFTNYAEQSKSPLFLTSKRHPRIPAKNDARKKKKEKWNPPTSYINEKQLAESVWLLTPQLSLFGLINHKKQGQLHSLLPFTCTTSSSSLIFCNE